MSDSFFVYRIAYNHRHDMAAVTDNLRHTRHTFSPAYVDVQHLMIFQMRNDAATPAATSGLILW